MSPENNFYPMPTLCISNEKGGVGKTFLSQSVAEWAARFLGLSVLMVDMDLQANLTTSLIGTEQSDEFGDGINYKVPPIHPDYTEDSLPEDMRPSIAGAFSGDSIAPYPTWINPEHFAGIEGFVDLIPAHGQKLESIAVAPVISDGNNLKDPAYNCVHTVIQEPTLRDHYDVVVIDTSPSRSVLTRAALRATTHLVVPLEFDVHSLEGLMSMKSTTDAENSFRESFGLPPIELIGVLPNKYVQGTERSAGISAVLYDEVKEKLGSIFLSEHSFIPQAEVVKKVLSGKHRSGSIFDVTTKSKSEYRLRLALEHACIEILHPMFTDYAISDKLDRQQQRVRIAQKKLQKST